MAALVDAGAVPRLAGAQLGTVALTSGEREVDTTMEAMPCVVWDAVVIPDGEAAVQQLALDRRALEFVKDQCRHSKPILALGAAASLLTKPAFPPPSMGATLTLDFSPWTYKQTV